MEGIRAMQIGDVMHMGISSENIKFDSKSVKICDFKWEHSSFEIEHLNALNLKNEFVTLLKEKDISSVYEFKN